MEFIDWMFKYFANYGIITLFIIIFLEHINTPGLPAGLIMPAVGVLISQHKVGFITAIGISILAGVAGSLLMYIIGYLGGAKLLDKIQRKYPSLENSLNKARGVVNSKKCSPGIVCRFLPVVRTLISIVEGGLRVNFTKFMITSVIGIGLFNMIYILGGYFLGAYLIL